MSGSESYPDSEFQSGVTISQVRTALKGIPSTKLSDDTIRQSIEVAEDIVAGKAGSLTSSLARVAVLDLATYRVASRNYSLFKDSKSALDVEASFDVETWISQLKASRDESLEDVSEDAQPSLHTLGDRRQRTQSQRSYNRYS